jgi:hypothetical protein
MWRPQAPPTHRGLRHDGRFYGAEALRRGIGELQRGALDPDARLDYHRATPHRRGAPRHEAG